MEPPGRSFRPGRPRRREGGVVRLYRAGLRLLPRSVQREDGEEMTWAFARLWEGRTGLRARLRLAAVAFGRLPMVALREWKDELTSATAPGPGRNQRRWGTMSWLRNLSYALRTLRKAPAFALTTILLLALGVGAVTTIFSLADHILLRPLPYPSPEHLILVENGNHPGPVFRAFETMRSVEAWGADRSETVTLVGSGEPLRLQQDRVSRDYFALFGARPSLGRLLAQEDFGAADAVVLSHGTWQRVFGSDPGILGRTLLVDGAPVTVVGVMRSDFLPPEASGDKGPDLWRPLDWSSPELNSIQAWILEVVGRTAPGVTLTEVNDELTRISAELARAYPQDRVDRDGDPIELPATNLQESLTRQVRTGIGLLLGAVGLLLLVACMNVAHLFLARGLGRVQEMAVRRALGADTSNLFQQLLVESMLLGAAGGALGVGLAFVSLKVFLLLDPTALPGTAEVSLDGRVLSFAALVSLASAVLFGLVPALRSAGHDLTDDLKGLSRGATSGRPLSRSRNVLVVAEVALSLVLVASAGLLLKSFVRVQARDPGFRAADVWSIPLSPTTPATPQEYVELMDQVEASMARVAGVTDVGYSLTAPFEMTGSGRCCWMNSSVVIDGETREGIRIFLQPATAGYFQALGIPLAAGRVWLDADVLREPWPVVLSESLAVQLFGSAQAALGRVFTAGTRGGTVVQVEGVAGDTRHFGLDQDPPSFVYLPMERLPFTIPMAHVVLHRAGDAPSGWARTLREAVWAAAPGLPVPTVQTMSQMIDASTAGRRFDSVLFGAFGVVALLLAGAGLYGTLLYLVGQRRRELGIRLALGAARGSLERSIVARGLTLTVLGSLLGLGAARGTGRFLESRLYDLAPSDPATLAGAVLLLLAAAAMASWLPARRAARVDPMEVLREE